MAVTTKNSKSQQRTVRIPHEVIEGIEQTQEPDESTGQFIVTALKGEIKRRQRKKPKSVAED